VKRDALSQDIRKGIEAERGLKNRHNQKEPIKTHKSDPAPGGEYHQNYSPGETRNARKGLAVEERSNRSTGGESTVSMLYNGAGSKSSS